ncbi:UDP-glucose/GDP-mannose dehydrogenase family protein [Desulfosarcina widdelii]|uniref:UDP-glucose 6-dehydrogenase n=1 Tax=Desulfosarcina widdelii TaxID=947919 RepID=A0A5K7Z6N8_9BACT|nr:UDP-glucose/GDP-mannose dehydrogenase family protein [Desulfosarcina widdelii]BBO77672.1 UDP-glucose/GDP-mannose dehydrogenase family protein [Desulfosarcina widdelii]
MKISVVGTGYVGLVSGVCLAELGHTVICVDVDTAKVDQINRGDSPIYEQGLDELLQKNLGTRLTATTDLERAVHETELSMIAVGTPFDGRAIDLSFVRQAAEMIGDALKTKSAYHVVVVKSTVIPGTTDSVVTPALENASGKKAGADFGVGMNPEFLREGDAVADFMRPDRIVLGACDSRSHGVMRQLYEPFTSANILSTNSRTAEMIKYTANSLLATLISFSNEIGNLCKKSGEVDVAEVMKGVHLDKRLSPIGENGRRIVPAITTFIEAGCGFGGSCFPKDVKALIAYGQSLGESMSLLDAVIRINREQPGQIIAMLKKHFHSLQGVSVAILGLAFKPETDDMRESPAIPVIHTLVEQGARIHAFDPVARNEAKKLFGDAITYAETLEDALADSSAVAILTRWDAFKRLPRLVQAMHPQPLVIDGRRMLDKKDFDRYEGIGMGERSL